MTLAIVVTGKVQGVFYRASTRDKAKSLGLTGCVRNLDDGKVYIEAQGEEGKLRELVAWCQHGPKYANVESVEVSETELKQFTKFEIKH